jgi:hypothetical protein
MHPDAIAAWIGRKCRLWAGENRNIASQREFTLLEVLGEETHNIVFRVADNYGESVLKFPRNHLGFHICMPPNRLFPEFQGDQRYDERFLSRISALQGSDAVSTVFPLEGLWNALAVQRLRAFDRVEQSIDADEYLEFNACDLVNDRLIDWSDCNLSRRDDEIVVIYEDEKPIYTDSAATLAKEAQAALAGVGAPICRLGENPLLLWIAAASSGFGLPRDAVAFAAAALQKLPDPDLAIKQAHLALRYAGRQADWDERLAMLDFMNRVVRQCLEKAPGPRVCLGNSPLHRRARWRGALCMSIFGLVRPVDRQSQLNCPFVSGTTRAPTR